VADEYVLITREVWGEIVRVVRKVDGLNGLGVTNTPSAISIGGGLGASEEVLLRSSKRSFRIAQITEYAQQGSKKQWIYTGRLWSSPKDSEGYASTSILADDITIYNLTEYPNGVTGRFGNGVTQANLDAINSQDNADGTYAVQPIPIGTPVFVLRVTTASNTVEYWTQYENGVDGSCATDTP